MEEQEEMLRHMMQRVRAAGKSLPDERGAAKS